MQESCPGLGRSKTNFDSTRHSTIHRDSFCIFLACHGNVLILWYFHFFTMSSCLCCWEGHGSGCCDAHRQVESSVVWDLAGFSPTRFESMFSPADVPYAPAKFWNVDKTWQNEVSCNHLWLRLCPTLCRGLNRPERLFPWILLNLESLVPQDAAEDWKEEGGRPNVQTT